MSSPEASSHAGRGPKGVEPATELSRSTARFASAQRWRKSWALGLLVGGLALAIVLATVVSPATSPRRTAVGIGSRIGAAYELTALTRPETFAADTAQERAIARAEETFGLNVLRDLVRSGGTGNELLSPLSLAEALTMANVGARGETSAQLTDGLALGGLSRSEQLEGLGRLQADLANAATDDHVVLSDANSIWAQTGFPVRSSFLTALERDLGAGVWLANFSGDPDAAVRSVNEWVGDATHRHISSLLGPNDVAHAAAVLLNAVFFKARWATAFDGTTNAPFYGPSGTDTVRYLVNDDESLMASFGHGLDAVQLPYWSGTQGLAGRYAALLLMPASGSLPAFVDALTPSSLSSIVSGLTPQGVNLRVPALKLASSQQLVPTLESLGITDAFNSGADFAGFSRVPTMISEVKQDATLALTRWGTIASAATGVVITPTAVEVAHRLVVNHPFCLVVRDTQTGAILFASVVNDPSDA